MNKQENNSGVTGGKKNAVRELINYLGFLDCLNYEKEIRFWKKELKLSDEQFQEKYSIGINRVLFSLIKDFNQLCKIETRKETGNIRKTGKVFAIFLDLIIFVSRDGVTLKEVYKKFNEHEAKIWALTSKKLRLEYFEKDAKFLRHLLTLFARVSTLNLSENRFAIQSYKMLYKNAKSQKERDSISVEVLGMLR